MEVLTEGSAAPAFTLQNSNGKSVSLDEYRGKWLVIYFYPKDNTSGCTKEAMDFSALREEFLSEGCEILGISPDSPESHAGFITKHDLSVTLLSDPQKETLAAYGAWGLKKNYGKEYEGVIRSTFLLDPEGTVRYAWKKVQVRRKTKTCTVLHASRVLEKLKELKTKV
ncbi:peroxiredoxin [Candidatus Fermentibacteria bacterium]|nr:MAG: peroxiredoxin [Candidatus Fermentibacteria bacterium]